MFVRFIAEQALFVDALADKRVCEQELSRAHAENGFLKDQASTPTFHSPALVYIHPQLYHDFGSSETIALRFFSFEETTKKL